jgi:hypothetical protein
MKHALPFAVLLLPLGFAHVARAATWDDPAAYCAAVGTIDKPDARYTGPAMPDWIAGELRKAMGAPDSTPLAPFRNGIWRCDAGKVRACDWGANLPCDTKADLSPTPPPGAVRYCAGQPNAIVVPAYATGRATVFEWRCEGTKAVAGPQIQQPDDRGFIASIWYTVAKPK